METHVNKNIYQKLIFDIYNSSCEYFIDNLYKNISHINTTNSLGEGLLHYCCLIGDVNKFTALINMGCEVFYTKNNNSLLHYASYSSKDNYLITELIKTGFSPLFKNNIGQTPIHMGGDIVTATYYGNWLNINRIKPSELLDAEMNTVAHTSKILGQIEALRYWEAQGLRDCLNIYGKTPSQMKSKRLNIGIENI